MGTHLSVKEDTFIAVKTMSTSFTSMVITAGIFRTNILDVLNV